MKNPEVVLTNDLRASAEEFYRFGDFVLDSRKRILLRADSPVFLTPKAFDLLIFLVQNPNRLVTKDELLQAVWQDTFVEEGSLTRYMSHLRKALADDAEDTRLIVTIARKGYQFTEKVVIVSESKTDSRQIAENSAESQAWHAGSPPVLEPLTKKAVPKATGRWWIAAFVVASTVILLIASYMSWRHFRASGQPRTKKIMLAVLPFENLTGDSSKAYLADGLTDETISQLGNLAPDRLGVIARTSVIEYKRGSEHVDQVGRDLAVQYVLEDSLRESGDHMRITSLLLRVKDQTLLWSHDYDYRAQDTLTVEDDVAKAVAGAIQLRLASEQQSHLPQSHPVNPEAFDAYLQGYYFFERATDQDTKMAGRYFERAIKIDPDYALPWVGLSRVNNWEANVGLVPTREGQRLAHEAVQRALALDPNLPEAYSQMGRIQQYDDLDWTGAEASFQRAMSLEPGNPAYIRQAAEMSGELGQFKIALEEARKAVSLDPLNSDSWVTLAEIEVWAGQLREAEADCKKAMELNPDSWVSPIWLGLINLMQGRPQDTLQQAARVEFPERLTLDAIAYGELGRKKESDSALAKLIAKYSTTNAFSVAVVYAYRNQRNEAFDWLNRAYAEHDNNLSGTAVFPFLNNLRGDARYTALLRKLKLPS
jgi:DNA-binding winged helix-turn-helix (wHTH) protein/TolB-like protein